MIEKHTETKHIAKIILIIASLIFTLHFLFFNYTLYVFIPFVKAIYILSEIFILGFFILSKIGMKKESVPESIGMGLIFTSFIFYIFSFLKILNPFVFFIYFVLPFPILYIIIKNSDFENRLITDIKGFLKRNPLEYLAFVLPFIYASLPPTFYDSLVYHLGIPNLYIQNGGFIKTPFMLFANTSIYYELSLIPSVFTSDFTPRLFHLLISAIFILCFVDYFTKKLKLTKKYYLLLGLLSLPVSLFLLTTVKNDIIAAFFIFLGIKKYFEDKRILSGIFFGFSIGIKYFSILPIALFLLIEIIKERKIEFGKLFIIAIIILLILFPLFIKNYVYAGNPIFPFLNKYFHLKNWDNSRMEIMKRDVGKIFHNIEDFLKSPYNLSFKNYGSGGRIGPLFLIFLPFLTIWGIDNLDILIFALSLIFIGGWFTGSIRFMYIGIMLLVPFVIKSLEKLNSRIMKIIFIIVIGINFIVSFAILERIYDASSLFSGKTSVYEYKTFRFPAYKMYSFINMMVKKQNKILVVGEARGYYLKRKYSISSAIDYSILKPYINKSKNSADFLKLLRNDGYDFVFINFYEFSRLQKEYKRLNKKELNKFYSIIKQIKPVFHKNSMFLFKVL